jgi:hypothetical protein
MRDPKPAYPITLSTEEVQLLKQLVRAHRTPQAQAMRARIILTAHTHPEQSNQQIAGTVGTTDRTVRAWPGRSRQDAFPRRCTTQWSAQAFSPSDSRASDGHRL